MPATTSPHPTALPPWTLAGTVATARAAGTEASLDLATPAAGLVVGHDHLLGVDLRAAAGPPADHWARGVDLTAVYEPDDARRLRATAMWRVRPGAVPAWELVVSAQTSLLHADAALAVVSRFAADDAWWAAPGTSVQWAPTGGVERLPSDAAFVLARAGASSVLVAVHPQDPRDVRIERAAGRLSVTCGIFPVAIEKGVILRSRVLAALGPASGAASWAADLCRAFAASPPFLAT